MIEERVAWCRLRDLHCERECREKQYRRVKAARRYPQ